MLRQQFLQGSPIGFFSLTFNAVLIMAKKENDGIKLPISVDNGGRRSGGDRRNYSYSLHIPERRKGNDRREGKDRRKFTRVKDTTYI